MLGLGKYSHHRKLNTEPELDDLFDSSKVQGCDDQDAHNVLYIGNEVIKNCSEADYPNVVKKIYGQQFSPLQAMTHSKKLVMSVYDLGLLVTTPPSPSGSKQDLSSTVSMNFTVPYIAYLSSDNSHKKVLAIVCNDGCQGNDVTLSVFVCEDEDTPVTIMEDCVLKMTRENNVRKIAGIKKSNYPAAIAFKYEDGVNPVLTTDTLKSKASENTQSLTQPPQPTSESPNDFDLDDEFSKLALKRNTELPDHLQDKTVESAFLIQDEQFGEPASSQSVAKTTSESNSFFKTNFFSSYSRVSSGTS